MAETYFPRRLILAGAIVSGVLLALAVHMLGARYGLDLGGLWRSDASEFMPAGAAIGWWLIATLIAMALGTLLYGPVLREGEAVG